jgi:AraC-like DNA-binding protein
MPRIRQPEMVKHANKMIRLVHANPAIKLSAIAKTLGVSYDYAKDAFQLHQGKSFSAFVKEVREGYIVAHQTGGRETLAHGLGVSTATIDRLVTGLNEQGMLHIDRRKAPYIGKPPFFYTPSALKIMRLIGITKATKGISTQAILEQTGLNRSWISSLLPKLARHKLVEIRVSPKNGMHYYGLSSAGKKWLVEMEKERKRRDAKK